MSKTETLDTLAQERNLERMGEANALHIKIVSTGVAVATSMVEFSRLLKEMRDQRLYEELDFTEFGEYVEKAVGLKQRQAYNYIANYERLGPHLLESQGHLGVTKLQLLSEISAPDRADFLDEHDMAGMSVAEVKELVKKTTDQGQQLSMLQTELEDATASEKTYKGETARLTEENRELARKLEEARAFATEAQSEPKASFEGSETHLPTTGAGATGGPVFGENNARERGKAEAAPEDGQDMEERLATAREEAAAEARKQAEAELQKRLKAERAQAAKEAEEKQAKGLAAKLEKARAEGAAKAKEEAEAQAKRETAALEAREQAAQQRAEELAKKLELANSEESAAFAVYFEQLQGAYAKMMEQAAALEQQGKGEEAAKLRGALKKALAVLVERL